VYKVKNIDTIYPHTHIQTHTDIFCLFTQRQKMFVEKNQSENSVDKNLMMRYILRILFRKA